MNIQFILNGEDVQLKAEAGDPLSNLLHHGCRLDSVHHNCGQGSCGRCLVLFNGQPVNSCLIPAFQARGSEVISFEGLQQTPDYAYILRAIEQTGVELCAFCRPAICLLIATLLERSNRPSNQDIAELLSAVQCRCTAPEEVYTLARSAFYLKEGRSTGHED